VTDPFSQSALSHADRNDTKFYSIFFQSFILHFRPSLASRKKSLRITHPSVRLSPCVSDWTVSRILNVSHPHCVNNKQTTQASSAQQLYCLTTQLHVSATVSNYTAPSDTTFRTLHLNEIPSGHKDGHRSLYAYCLQNIDCCELVLGATRCHWVLIS
jgi:hypothetical protein